MQVFADINCAPVKFKNRVIDEYQYQLCDDTFDKVRSMEQPAASCLMLDTKTFRETGLFDERFPLFFNDVDLFKRMHDRGCKTYFIPDARIIHFVGKGHDSKGDMERHEFFVGWLRYLKKHHRLFVYLSAKGIICFDLIMMTIINLFQILIGKKKVIRFMPIVRFRLNVLLDKSNF